MALTIRNYSLMLSLLITVLLFFCRTSFNTFIPINTFILIFKYDWSAVKASKTQNNWEKHTDTIYWKKPSFLSLWKPHPITQVLKKPQTKPKTRKGEFWNINVNSVYFSRLNSLLDDLSIKRPVIMLFQLQSDNF